VVGPGCFDLVLREGFAQETRGEGQGVLWEARPQVQRVIAKEPTSLRVESEHLSREAGFMRKAVGEAMKGARSHPRRLSLRGFVQSETDAFAVSTNSNLRRIICEIEHEGPASTPRRRHLDEASSDIKPNHNSLNYPCKLQS